MGNLMLNIKYGVKMVEFEITRLEGDLKLKSKMLKSERLEFDKLKKTREKDAEEKERIKQLRRELRFKKKAKLEQEKRDKEDRAYKRKEKSKEIKLRKEFETEKEKRLEVLRIEEIRLINLTPFQIHNEPGNEYLSFETEDYILNGIKERLLKSVRAGISLEEERKFYRKIEYKMSSEEIRFNESDEIDEDEGVVSYSTSRTSSSSRIKSGAPYSQGQLNKIHSFRNK